MPPGIKSASTPSIELSSLSRRLELSSEGRRDRRLDDARAARSRAALSHRVPIRDVHVPHTWPWLHDDIRGMRQIGSRCDGDDRWRHDEHHADCCHARLSRVCRSMRWIVRCASRDARVMLCGLCLGCPIESVPVRDVRAGRCA